MQIVHGICVQVKSSLCKYLYESASVFFSACIFFLYNQVYAVTFIHIFVLDAYMCMRTCMHVLFLHVHTYMQISAYFSASRHADVRFYVNTVFLVCLFILLIPTVRYCNMWMGWIIEEKSKQRLLLPALCCILCIL